MFRPYEPAWGIRGSLFSRRCLGPDALRQARDVFILDSLNIHRSDCLLRGENRPLQLISPEPDVGDRRVLQYLWNFARQLVVG